MEPNSQDQQTGPSGSVNFNIQPPAPEPTPIISSEPETPNTAPTEQPKKKSNVLTLLLIFIALCGIAFGIYGMFLQTPKEKVVTKTVEKIVEKDCEECVCNCPNNENRPENIEGTVTDEQAEEEIEPTENSTEE